MLHSLSVLKKTKLRQLQEYCVKYTPNMLANQNTGKDKGIEINIFCSGGTVIIY